MEQVIVRDFSIIFVFVVLCFDLSFQATSAFYSKTNIIPYNCDYSVKLSTSISPTMVGCALLCSADADCRRFLFCKSSMACSLYLDSANCIMSGDSSDCSCFQKTHGYIGSKYTCPWGYYGANCEKIAIDCTDAVANGMFYSSGDIVTNIQPVASTVPFEVLCSLAWGGWTKILHRAFECSSENFNRSLAEYEAGFGTISYNSWIGFDKILQILSNPNTNFMLVVEASKTDWGFCQMFYDQFTIGNKSKNYAFDARPNWESATTPCGDSLTGLNLSLVGNPFSTYDVDFTENNHCPSVLGGGWWYADIPSCSRSFLTGTTDNFWKDNLEGEQLNRVSMKIRNS